MARSIAEKYVRVPFPVEAVRVTEENMNKVRQWCDGRVEKMQGSEVRCIKVRVSGNITQRNPDQAYVGNWVVYIPGSGYKVYTHQAFKRTFKKPAEAKDEPQPPAKASPQAMKKLVEKFNAPKKEGDVRANEDVQVTPTSTEEPAIEKEEKNAVHGDRQADAAGGADPNATDADET